MRKLRIVMTSLCLVLAPLTVRSEGEFLEKFMSNYKVSDSGSLAERSCGICHVSDSDFNMNSYGKQIAVAMAGAGQTNLTSAILKRIESMDADGDGFNNIEEIRADKAPGDSKDKPVGAPKPPPAAGGTKPPVAGSGSGAKPPAGKTEPAKTEGGGEGQPVPGGEKAAPPTTGTTSEPEETPIEEPKPPSRLIPKNGFHPAVVHFPIALFIGGLLLDTLGLVMRKRELLFAGWYNLVLAAVSAVGGVITGYLAVTLMKLPFRGLIQEHFLYAIIGSFVMWMMVAMRVHRHEEMNLFARSVYYMLAIAGLALISYAGHVGGVLVYRE